MGNSRVRNNSEVKESKEVVGKGNDGDGGRGGGQLLEKARNEQEQASSKKPTPWRGTDDAPPNQPDWQQVMAPVFVLDTGQAMLTEAFVRDQ